MEAFFVFAAAALTDFLDGLLARILKQQTRLGAFLDPIGDKILMTLSFILLSLPSIAAPATLPLYLTFFVIGRDIYIVAGAIALYKLVNKKDFPPSFLGKACTIAQMSVLTLVLFLNAFNLSFDLLVWLYFFTLFLTVLSGLHYTYIGWQEFAAGKKQGGLKDAQTNKSGPF